MGVVHDVPGVPATKAQVRTSAAVPAAAPTASPVAAITAVLVFLALALLVHGTTVPSKVGLLAGRWTRALVVESGVLGVRAAKSVLADHARLSHQGVLGVCILGRQAVDEEGEDKFGIKRYASVTQAHRQLLELQKRGRGFGVARYSKPEQSI